MIHQHYKLIEVFTAAQNIILGLDEEKMDLAKTNVRVKEICDRYGFEIDPARKVYDMSVSQKQTIEIVKVLYRGAEILILDDALSAVDGIDNNIMAALLDRDLSLSMRILEYCERVNVGIMTLSSSVYPERLRSIHAKPILLYYRGRIPDIDDHVMIACVGTRKCSKSGAVNAERLGRELACAGAVVVSGMALGIDACAQRGALSAGGHTIAVLGCGIDRVYPPENRELMEEIAEHGTLITEYAPGSDPAGKHFPVRNRIISGLCQGTVVVEADLYSGSLITARAARMQGRDLFAFPGNPEDRRSEGTNTLIREGAKLVTCAADILNEYELLYPHRIFTEKIPSSGFSGSKKARTAGFPALHTERRGFSPRA